MDGFPNGRRLEDDVTRIELQAVSGAVLAAIGLWYDDYTAGDPNPVTQDLLNVLTYTTGVEANDKPFERRFPYLAQPWAGDGICSGQVVSPVTDNMIQPATTVIPRTEAPMQVRMANYPNPFKDNTTLRYQLEQDGAVSIDVYNMQGQRLTQLVNGFQEAGTYEVEWNAGAYPAGLYFARIMNERGEILQIQKLVKSK